MASQKGLTKEGIIINDVLEDDLDESVTILTIFFKSIRPVPLRYQWQLLKAFKEGGYAMDFVENTNPIWIYPSEVLADQTYCTRVNRTQLAAG